MAFDVGRSEGVANKTKERKRPADEGARRVEGAGRMNEKLWTVEVGWGVEAIITTSRVNDN